MNDLSKINGFFSRLVDLFLLNILFVLAALPLITFGPALTALYSVTLKMVRGEDAYPVRSFLRSFRENFRQAFPVSLIFACGAALLSADIRIALTHPGMLFTVIGVLSGVALVLLGICALYFFPILARFRFTTKEIFLHIFAMIADRPGAFASLVLLNVPFVFFFFYSPYTGAAVTVFLLMIGFAAMSYVQSLIFRPLFAPYEQS